ncbi:undecaprenyldiphospho-muramoylpentapeptide beta-N-acetylglucosaminyltransferase [Methylotenera versatilis]|uniref:undecaprenyldiphospho-muramoylpentapeptide beta-N-acetylglucosaminyltransferase n=1 Tax=Methylotenera versatilis TaxID=1055487 RepID=UPI000648C2B8|nr:undecaprenyldiphospho-muramoylpentapeptide beta-N-acetylglucosaminyltransferase [Methylotenera versatilis]
MMLASPVTEFGKFTIMIMAGGTGGHVYPAMAVADYLKEHGWNVVWLCTEGGMENRLIEGKNYSKAIITMRGVRGKGLLNWLSLPLKLATAFKQSFSAIRLHQPDVVLGMGGFAAFPGGVMAKLLGKSLVIHEQNSIAGLTNKILSLVADKTLVAFPSAFAKGTVFGDEAILVGNPVRKDITQLPFPAQRYASRTGKLKLLVVGGSLGATALNEVLPKAIATLSENSRPEVIHQAGEKHIAALQANYQAAGVTADTKAFIHNMAELYAWADVVVCRSGALTVAELSCVGVASILVPFPSAVDDHQTYNAKYLSDAGAAKLIQQTEFNVAKASELLGSLTREICLEMAIKAKKLAKPEATEVVANICMEATL